MKTVAIIVACILVLAPIAALGFLLLCIVIELQRRVIEKERKENTFIKRKFHNADRK